MRSHSHDTFNDAELSLMAMQIMKDLQLKETLDPDEESLTNLAIEIMQDLSTKPNLDPNDSYIQKLDGMDLFNHDINTSTSNSKSNVHEINDSIDDDSIEISLQHEGFQFEPEISSSDTSASSTNTSSTSPSLPPSTNPSLEDMNTYSTDATDNNMVYVSYPQMSPQILSSNRLINNDSFINDGIQIPSIPSPNNNNNNRFRFPGNKNHKRAVNGWLQYQNHKREWKNNINNINNMKAFDSNNTLNSTGSKLPYIQPPTLFINKSGSKTSDFTLSPRSINSDIESCISPRYKTPKQRNAVIPDFSHNNNAIIRRQTSLPKKIPNNKKRKTKKQKIFIEKHPLKKVISPIFIDVNINDKINKNKKEKKLMSSTTPTVKQMNFDNKRYFAKRKAKKVRANSIACDRPNINLDNNINEYAIETNDGFIFIDPYKL